VNVKFASSNQPYILTLEGEVLQDAAAAATTAKPKA